MSVMNSGREDALNKDSAYHTLIHRSRPCVVKAQKAACYTLVLQDKNVVFAAKC